MICKKCGAKMFIDSWNGWVWTCIFGKCDYIGRAATKSEIQEAELTLKIKDWNNDN